MYGTVAHFRVKPGHRDELNTLIQEWNTERRPKIQDAVSGYLVNLDSDPQAMIMVGIFENKEVYQANANDLDQDAWHQRLMGHLESEPQWHDGGFVAT